MNPPMMPGRSMLRRALFPLFVIWLFCLSSPDVGATNGYTIVDVRIEGNRNFSGPDLKRQIDLHSAGWLTRLFTSREPSVFTETSFAEDSLRLQRFYQRRGFLDATINRGQFRTNSSKKQLGITFVIEEGEPILVGEVTASAKEDIPADYAQAVAEICADVDNTGLVPGRRFSDIVLYADQDSLITAFAEHGFPYADVSFDLDLNRERRIVDVHWAIDPGPRCYFGTSRVLGNENIADHHITYQLVYDSGARYDPRLLGKSQSHIFEMGMFSIVTLNARLKPTKDSILNINVSVDEAPRYSTEFGAGYGREDNIRVFGRLSTIGILDDISQIGFYAKHSGLEPYHFELTLGRPALFAPRIYGLSAFELTKRAEPAFSVIVFGIGVGILQEFSDNLSLLSALKYERLDLDLGSISHEDVDTEQLEEILDLYNRASIRFELTWDTSEPRRAPRHGYLISLTPKLSGIIIKSISRYAKVELDIRKYTPWGRAVIATRVKGGLIDAIGPVDFVPNDDRFFSGGSNSVRGWGRYELGPIDADDVPIGGNSLLELGLELRYPIWKAFSGVLFTDMGNVWRGSYAWKIDDLRYSAGFGLRFSTLVGKIRADFARPVSDVDNTWQFHFSIGEAF